MHADLEPYFDVVALSLSGADDYCGEVGINGIHKATGMKRYLEYVGIPERTVSQSETDQTTCR